MNTLPTADLAHTLIALAAIVIPQFTNASTEARQSNVRSQLQTLRSQIELYKLQHLDQLPSTLIGASPAWTQMTVKTDASGATEVSLEAVTFGRTLSAAGGGVQPAGDDHHAVSTRFDFQHPLLPLSLLRRPAVRTVSCGT